SVAPSRILKARSGCTLQRRARRRADQAETALRPPISATAKESGGESRRGEIDRFAKFSEELVAPLRSGGLDAQREGRLRVRHAAERPAIAEVYPHAVDRVGFVAVGEVF